jgi:hypothetical protein
MKMAGRICLVFFLGAAGAFSAEDVAGDPAGAGEGAAGPVALVVQGKDSVAMGRLMGAGTSNVVFRLKNTAKETVSIKRLYVTCPCLKAVSNKTAVPPGEEVEVTLSINLAMVHGDFTRGAFVFSDQRPGAEAKLLLTGKVVPVVDVAPSGVTALMSAGTGGVFTNIFTLTVADGRYSPGEPVVKAGEGMESKIFLAPDGKTNWTATVVTRISAPGKHLFEVRIPVLGEPRQEDIKLPFRVQAGQLLTVVPRTIEVEPGGERPQTVRLVVRGDRSALMNSELLTWEPKTEGVSAVVTAGRGGRMTAEGAADGAGGAGGAVKRTASPSPLTITLTLSPAAIAALLASETPAVTLAYPGYEAFAVPVIAAETAAAAAGGRAGMPPSLGARLRGARRLQAVDAEDTRTRTANENEKE